MAVSEEIALALDLGTPYCSIGAHWLLIWGPFSSKGTRALQGGLADSLIRNPSRSEGQLAPDIGPYLVPGGMVSEVAPLTVDLEPLALGAHCILIWSPSLLHGPHWLLIWGPSLLQWSHDPWSPQ